jgi:hypothetical protein
MGDKRPHRVQFLLVLLAARVSWQAQGHGYGIGKEARHSLEVLRVDIEAEPMIQGEVEDTAIALDRLQQRHAPAIDNEASFVKRADEFYAATFLSLHVFSLLGWVDVAQVRRDRLARAPERSSPP